MEIVSYSPKYFAPLIAFLRKNWAENHTVYDRQLFDWQYGGPTEESSASVLLLDDSGDIRGFLGVVHYPFLLYDKSIEGAGLAIWVVDQDIKNSGAGLLIRKAVEDNFDMVYTIGANRSVVHYYQRRHYTYHDSLYRYVIPLDTKGYQLFLGEDCESREITDWLKAICFAESAIPLAEFDAAGLARIYADATAPHFSLRPQKDALFWEWRYQNSKGFSYLSYQTGGGAIVFRIECVHSPSDPRRHGAKCLRIIEILPTTGKVWDGNADEALSGAILSVLAWAKEQGCVLADFQISNARLSHVLEGVGFRMQQGKGVTNLVRLFSPYRVGVPPLNFMYRIYSEGRFEDIGREDTYFLKSDVDMDRPNYLP